MFDNHDLVCITETWAQDCHDLDVDGFSCFNLNRTEIKKRSVRGSGGIAIYIKNKYVTNDTMVTKYDDNYIWEKLNKHVFNIDKDLSICLCYIPPQGTSRQGLNEANVYNKLLENIVQLQQTTDNDAHFLILGDMNSRVGQEFDFVDNDNSDYLDLPDEYQNDDYLTRKSQDQSTNANGLLLLQFLKQTGLRIVNGRVGEDKTIGAFTFCGGRGSSVIDLVIAEKELFPIFKSFKVHEPNILSDHCIVEFSLKSVIDEENGQNTFRDTEYVQKIYKWNADHKEQYIDKLSGTNLQECVSLLEHIDNRSLNKTNIDNSLKTFGEKMEDICDPLFGKACKINAQSSYNTCESDFDETCKDKRKCFYRALNCFRKEKSDLNRKIMVNTRSEYKKAVRNFNFEKDRTKTQKLLNAKITNAKQYWKLLKSSANKSLLKPENLSSDNVLQYFKAVNNPNDPSYQADEDVLRFNENYLNSEVKIMFEELDVGIEYIEIKKAVSKLKKDKSGGPYLFLNELFIHGSDTLLPYLKALFNKIIDTGYFPDMWSDGYIVPLHKKGKTDDVKNFRGITLLSTLGKLFTRIINNRLNDWAENYNVYIEAQAGFRKEMSTIDNIFILNAIITHKLGKGEQLFCAFVDFTKAFDYVVRDIMWYKLIKIGVRGKLLTVIQSMYENIKSRVKLNNELSEAFECSLGVRQGECLSPFLFAMYVNDLEEEFYLKGADGIDMGMIKMFLSIICR